MTGPQFAYIDIRELEDSMVELMKTVEAIQFVSSVGQELSTAYERQRMSTVLQILCATLLDRAQGAHDRFVRGAA